MKSLFLPAIFIVIISPYSQNLYSQYTTKYGTGALANNAAARNTAFGYNVLNKNTSGNFNTGIGVLALTENTTGQANTALGTNTLWHNTTGSYNIAAGVNALTNNTSGQSNTASGYSALNWNTTGSYNTATGYLALHGSNEVGSSNTGSYNTATGSYVLENNTTGHRNTASGYQSLNKNTTGAYNTANGSNALSDNTTGTFNTASGYRALLTNSTGSYNTAYGVDALYSNTNGFNNTAIGIDALSFNTTGHDNTAIGVNVMFRNTAGNHNTAIGREVLFGNTTGFNNTAIGNYSLSGNTTGSRNTAIGDSAGAAFNSSYSTFLGYKTIVTATGFTNVTVIGNKASATASNQVRIGNTSVTSIGGKVGWSTLSDGRFKKNISEEVPGLAFITKLRPVIYTLDIAGIDNASGVGDQASGEEVVIKLKAAKEKHTGFIAQEVEKAANEMNYEFSGVDKPKNDKDFYSLRYAEFVVPLVKAVQELDLKTAQENKQLKEYVVTLEDRIRKLEALVMPGNINTGSSLSSAYLEQVAPNPSKGETTISFFVPENSGVAKLLILDMKGAIVKSITLNNRGKGQLNINSSVLAAGAYTCSLLVNGKQMDTKRLMVTK